MLTFDFSCSIIIKPTEKGGKNYMVGAPDKVKRYEEEFDTLDT